MPTGYNYTWAGEYDSLRKEQARLAFIVPISLASSSCCLYLQFGTWKDALHRHGNPSLRRRRRHRLSLRHPHLLQHFGGRRLHLADRRHHAVHGRLPVRSASRSARERRRHRSRTRLRRRDASRRHGLHGRWIWACFPPPSPPASDRRRNSRWHASSSEAWSPPSSPSSSSCLCSCAVPPDARWPTSPKTKNKPPTNRETNKKGRAQRALPFLRCRAGALRGQRSLRDVYSGFARGLPLVGIKIFQATNGSRDPKGI